MVFFIFIQILIEHSLSKQHRLANCGHPIQTNAASDLGLHCLPIFHKKDGRLILVNCFLNYYIFRCLPRKERVQELFNPAMFCTPEDELWKDIK